MPPTADALRARVRPLFGRWDVALRVGGARALQPTSTVARRRALNVSLAAFFALLAAAHVAYARATGEWVRVLPLLVQESVLVGLVLARRPARATSGVPADWLAGVAGVLLPLGLRPVTLPGRFALAGDVLQGLGVGGAIVALVWLGRRVGVVAAHRGIATGGPYRVVRHPAYAAYLAAYGGYLLSHPAPANAAIVVAWIAVTHARAVAEERLLARDPRYARYCERVPWRYVAGVV